MKRSKTASFLTKTPLAFMLAMVMLLSVLAYVACGEKKDNNSDALAVLLLATSGGVIPDPPADDTTYFQIMIDNRVSSAHTVHLTVTANRMLLTNPDINKITWLTGGGISYNDWTQPVFQIVDDTSGVSGGANFDDTRDITLTQLPLDSSGDYRILKIPFRDPGDALYSLAGSGHLTITLDKKADMSINTAGATTAGFAFVLPSPDPASAVGGQDRWDFMELNCATPASNGKSVCFVNTTNVDFFSLGITIKGRTSATTETYESFGLKLNGLNPVAGILSALKSLPSDYAAGLKYADDSTTFLRFQAPGLCFTSSSTAMDAAVTSGFNHYKSPNFLEFDVGSVHYKAQTNVAGDTLVFTEPIGFNVTLPISSLNVVAATGSLDVAGKSAQIQDGLKYIDAYLNRGVFENTAVWQTPSQWYPSGSVHNQYSRVLHQRFINSATYGFSFDDVPGNGVTSDPSISTCTSMTLVISSD